jgi:hypothetical protein
VLQVGDVAVHRALGHLEALRKKGGRGEAAAADELHELEEAVGAAHQRILVRFAAKPSTKPPRMAAGISSTLSGSWWTAML